MANQLYRKLAACVILGASVLSLAQSKPKQRTGPRAISVLEKDARGNMRLVPVTIWYQDRYYDASQYQANPVPMAAEPGNVYQVLDANTPVGWFTTGQPQQLRGNWLSSGAWQDQKKENAEKPAKVEVDLGKNDDRPVLKRHGESSSRSSTSDSKKTDDSDPDRPTLKKSKTADTADNTNTASDSQKKTDDNDSDRPTLKKNKSADNTNTATPTVAKTTAAPVDTDLTRDTNQQDPDRPVLRKTKTGVNPTDVDKQLSIPMGVTQKAAPEKVAPQQNAEIPKQYIAISDAEKSEYRPMAYELKPEDKPKYAAQMQKIAAPLLQKWALAHGGVKLPAAITFTDYDVRAYDVDYSNNPELIYSASYKPEPASPATKKKTAPKTELTPLEAKAITYYLTLVVRIDSNGDANPLFSQITDTTRLDAYSRLELVDAVDADGYGRGSLLFREYNDVGKAFVLYRVDAYNLTKLFEGASGE